MSEKLREKLIDAAMSVLAHDHSENEPQDVYDREQLRKKFTELLAPSEIAAEKARESFEEWWSRVAILNLNGGTELWAKDAAKMAWHYVTNGSNNPVAAEPGDLDLRNGIGLMLGYIEDGLPEDAVTLAHKLLAAQPGNLERAVIEAAILFTQSRVCTDASDFAEVKVKDAVDALLAIRAAERAKNHVHVVSEWSAECLVGGHVPPCRKCLTCGNMVNMAAERENGGEK